MSGNIDKSLAYRILKEDLLDEYKIKVQDENLFSVLNDASEGNKGALTYLENSTEIQELLKVLQGVGDTYNEENFDKIRSYLKENPELCNGFYFTCADFYQESFSDMIRYLQSDILQLQSMDDIFYLVQRISKRRGELKKIDFPQGHNELTFVVKVTFDLEDGALVHQVFIGKTQDVDAEILEVSDTGEDENDPDGKDDDALDEKEFNAKQEPFPIDQFLSVWSKRTCDKGMVLIILKSMSYGNTLFQMFDLEESALHK